MPALLLWLKTLAFVSEERNTVPILVLEPWRRTHDFAWLLGTFPAELRRGCGHASAERLRRPGRGAGPCRGVGHDVTVIGRGHLLRGIDTAAVSRLEAVALSPRGGAGSDTAAVSRLEAVALSPRGSAGSDTAAVSRLKAVVLSPRGGAGSDIAAVARLKAGALSPRGSAGSDTAAVSRLKAVAVALLGVPKFAGSQARDAEAVENAGLWEPAPGAGRRTPEPEPDAGAGCRSRMPDAGRRSRTPEPDAGPRSRTPESAPGAGLRSGEEVGGLVR